MWSRIRNENLNGIESKDIFYELLKSRVKLLDHEQAAPYTEIASFYGVGMKMKRGSSKLLDVDIYVDKSAFVNNDGDFTDLIPYAVRHEMAELWYIFHEPSPEEIDIVEKIPGNSEPQHKFAMYEQYLSANRQGGHETAMRLKNFLLKFDIVNNNMQDNYPFMSAIGRMHDTAFLLATRT